ncbi:anthranilate synthase component I, partial [Escherichia coli]|nr:anthranilate synthase component I [Escherichia coli]
YHSEPALLFNTLCEHRHHTLLLESAQIDTKANLKSLLIVDSALHINANKNQVTVNTLTKNNQYILGLLNYPLKAKRTLSVER